MKTEFTPGPWGVRITETGHKAIFNVDGNWLATTTRKHWAQEDRANARLIAAAPDLYAALEMVVANISRTLTTEQFSQVSAALSKARGEQP